jgi:hypothetical protein
MGRTIIKYGPRILLAWADLSNTGWPNIDIVWSHQTYAQHATYTLFALYGFIFYLFINPPEGKMEKQL